MPKVYLVEMTHRETGVQFQKIGWCVSYDVTERFSAETSRKYGRPEDQYDAYNIRVLASAYSPLIQEVKDAETALKTWYPKNIFIEDTFSGITEIVSLDPDQRESLITTIRLLNKEWGRQRSEAQAKEVPK